MASGRSGIGSTCRMHAQPLWGREKIGMDAPKYTIRHMNDGLEAVSYVDTEEELLTYLADYGMSLATFTVEMSNGVTLQGCPEGIAMSLLHKVSVPSGTIVIRDTTYSIPVRVPEDAMNDLDDLLKKIRDTENLLYSLTEHFGSHRWPHDEEIAAVEDRLNSDLDEMRVRVQSAAKWLLDSMQPA